MTPKARWILIIVGLLVANALAMGSDAANACQGATFTTYLAAGP